LRKSFFFSFFNAPKTVLYFASLTQQGKQPRVDADVAKGKKKEISNSFQARQKSGVEFEVHRDANARMYFGR
jgi:hypothetical protein